MYFVKAKLHQFITCADSDGVNDDSVLAWKFDHLDKDKDSMLHKNETLILKNLVKQQIQPRACAKNFISFCAKGDQRITKKEWIECLRIPSVDNRKFSFKFKSLSSTHFCCSSTIYRKLEKSCTRFVTLLGESSCRPICFEIPI